MANQILSRIEGYVLEMEQEFRKRENGNEDDLLSFLEEFYRGFGSVMKDSLKNEPKDIRDGVRNRCRPLVDMCMDTSGKKLVDFRSTGEYVERTRAMLKNMQTAVSGRRHCLCWAEPCEHSPCKCGRHPPFYALPGENVAVCCSRCKTDKMVRIFPIDEQAPLEDELRRREQELRRSGDRHFTLRLDSRSSKFDRRNVHEACERAGLFSCSLGTGNNRSVYIFGSTIAEEKAVWLHSIGSRIEAETFALPRRGDRGKGNGRARERSRSRGERHRRY